MSTPHYRDDAVTVYGADCLEVLRELADDSIDAVVTDPPYGLAEHPRRNIERALSAWLAGDRSHVPDGRGFMSRRWDRFVPPPAVWDECFRVLKPGGHLLAFAGTRTVDLMGISIRLAGLTSDTSPEIRDSIAWLYGSGFPKSRDVGKAIDEAAGAQRSEVTGVKPGHEDFVARTDAHAAGTRSAGWDRPWKDDPAARDASHMVMAPVTEQAQLWDGWGTALKPAFEPIIVARKPLTGTVAANVVAHGTGALNIAACRTPHASPADLAESTAKNRHADFGSGPRGNRVYGADDRARGQAGNYDGSRGRWPTNVALDDSQAAALDQQAGERQAGNRPGSRAGLGYGSTSLGTTGQREPLDAGGAARYFPTFRYEPKAPTSERPTGEDGATHPTVKPLTLMRWLVRLVTRPGGLVLDPFAGTGTTGEACLLEGILSVLIENDPACLPMIMQRLSKPLQPGLGLDL